MRRLTLELGTLVGVCVAACAAPGWAQDDATETPSQTQAATIETVGGEATAATAETPPAATPGGGVDSGLISVDFKEADIRQVLRVIALKSEVDIVAGSDVEGLVTIKLNDIPWEQALDIILRTYGFTYERRGRIIRVMTVEALEQEALATEVFPLNYAKAADVPAIINEMLSDRGRVRFDERTNTLIVTDVPSSLFQISKVVERIDQRTPQVLIQTRIVETRLEKDENLGIRWNDAFALAISETTFPSSFPFPAGGTFGSIGDNFVATPVPTGDAGSIGIGTLTGPELSLTLNFLKQRSETNIVSNPTLAVLNNQEARIHIGEEFPVPTFSVDPQTGNTTISGFKARTIGTVMKVTPHVNPAREIVVNLEPEIVSVGDNATFQVGDAAADTVSLPRFNTQTVKTQVRIASGNTIAIGGLVKTIKITQENKVPVLGDLPLIGALFTNRHRFGGSGNPTLQQDLLIFLTVTLMEDEKVPASVASTTITPP